MIREILLASNNAGKVERYRRLLTHAGYDVTLYTPADLGIEAVAVVEDAPTLLGNALLKAHAYLGKTNLPILANDTGFFVEGEGFVDAPKRVALGGRDESTLSKEAMAEAMLAFWKNIARKHGGKVDAAWIEEFVLLSPHGTEKYAQSRREVILTDQEFGESHLQMPVRRLYISKATGKPALSHTPQEELVELQSIVDALEELLA